MTKQQLRIERQSKKKLLVMYDLGLACYQLIILISTTENNQSVSK